MLREGLIRLLAVDGIETVAAVDTAPALIDAVARLSPDLAIVDVRMPPTWSDEGVRAALELRERWPDVAVLILSQYVEERYAAELLSGSTRAIGYLLKDRVADVEEFLGAVRRVAEGGTALDPEVVAQLLVRRVGSPVDRLLLASTRCSRSWRRGCPTPGIAAALVVSESAVAKHVNAIFAKLPLPETPTPHRRVLAVLEFLAAQKESR
ncbi:MAG: response regulator transcription factor [Actinomycetales bacterium]|nr:response regulator transcription factor [Candidatus Phosphoribacter baldrii]